MESNLLQELLAKFPVFYETRVFITFFTAARHLFLHSARSVSLKEGSAEP